MRIRAAASLSLTLLLVTAPAWAQEAQNPPAKKPEAQGTELPRPMPEFIDANTIRRPNGMVVRFYRVNSVAPALLLGELNEWKTDAATIRPVGATYAVMSKDRKKPIGLVQNYLRIEEHEDNWPVLDKILAMIDTPQPQVYVEARIVEITYDDQLKVGIDASNIRVGDPVGDLFFKRADVEFDNPLGSSDLAKLTFGSGDKFVKFDYVLQLGKSGARAEVLSQPGVIASQGEQAEIRVGDDEPIVTQALSGTNVTASTKFEEVGVKLIVLPLLIGRDHVRARIEPEVSRVSDFRTTSTSQDRDVINPVISTRSAKTVVEVPDGETLVISGLQQTTEVEERKGIPLLMDIPLAGYLLGSTSKRKLTTELVIFVTFTILRPGEERIIIPPSERVRIAAEDAEE